MRLQEFENAEEQIKYKKLISDSVRHIIKLQAVEQEQKRYDLEKKQKKSVPRPKTVKKPKTVAAPKPKKLLKKQQVTDKSSIATKQQKSAQQTQKPQVLPKVFSNTQKSNLATPQTSTTSATSLAFRNNARRSVGVFSRATSALAHRRRGPAVLEDRGEVLVPAQRH